MDPLLRVEEDDLDDTSSYLAHILLNLRDFKLAGSNFEEVELRLIPLFQNGTGTR